MSIKQTILTVIFLTIILPAAAQDHDCYNVEELCSEQREGYSCTLVRFNAHDGDSISAYILMPDNASQDNPVPDIYPLLQRNGATNISTGCSSVTFWLPKVMPSSL